MLRKETVLYTRTLFGDDDDADDDDDDDDDDVIEKQKDNRRLQTHVKEDKSRERKKILVVAIYSKNAL